MLKKIIPIYSLLVATAILLLGSGLLGTVVALRAGGEAFPKSLIGLIMSGFFMGYVLGSYLCPWFIRSFGHIRSYSAFAAVGCVCVILHGLWVQPFVWLMLRILTGTCMLGMYLVIESWLNSLATNTTRGGVFAIYMTVNLLALGCGQFLLLVYDPRSVQAFSLIALFFALALVPIALTRMQQPAPVPSSRLGLRLLFATSPLAVFGALLSGMVSGAFWGMAPLYAASVGFKETGIALFMSGIIFGGALLQWPIGHLSDRLDRRLVIFVVSLIACLAAVAVFYLMGAHRTVGLLASFVFGGCAFSIYALSMAHANDHADGQHDVLEINRGLLLLSGVGSSIGPILGGALMQGLGASSLMILFAGLMLLLSVLALIRRSIGQPIRTEQQSDFIVMARTSPAMLDLDPRTELKHEAD